MAFINPRQIAKYQTNKVVLELNDKMAIAPVEFGANLHARYSKIEIVIVDTSKGKGENAVVTIANTDPIKIKRLYDKMEKIEHKGQLPAKVSGGIVESRIGIGDYRNLTPSQAIAKDGEEGVRNLKGLIPIFERNIEKYPINKKKIEEIRFAIDLFGKGELKTVSSEAPSEIDILLFEQKINPNEKRRNDAGEYPVTMLGIEYNPNMDNCWAVKMENGWGQKETYPNGGMSIKRGTYRKEKTTKVVVADETFREMIRQTSDYILLKEHLFMRVLEDQIKEFLEEERKKWAEGY